MDAGAGLGDESWMAEATALGERGRLSAPPNPWVGCVLVAAGEVVGRGFHRAPGEAHAERVAIAEAGARAAGATAYVTLEPCAHHGRTPPCTDALVSSGVARVVVAVVDPDPRVAGRGLAELSRAGIEIDVGAGAEPVAHSLAPYLHHRRTGRSLCLLKAAVSLDGRTAAADGSSRWITGPRARADGHRLRAESQAVVVGSGTALADRPALTSRDADRPVARQPLRVVLDSRGRVPAAGPLFDVSSAPTLVITTRAAPRSAVVAWTSAGAEVEEVPPGPGGVDLDASLRLLAGRGVLQALVEGGAALHGSFLRAGLADRLVLYVGPIVLGEAGLPLAAGPGPSTLEGAWRFRFVGSTSLDGDLKLDYRPGAAGGGVA